MFHWASKLIVVGFVIGSLVLVKLANPFSDRGWTLERIQTALHQPLPDDAVDVHYDGTWDNVTVLNLTFKASSESMEDFTNTICGESLHQSYDPFYAVNVSTPTQYNYEVRVTWPDPAASRIYYSYSPNTPDTVWGANCPILKKLMIRVDRSDPLLHALTLQYEMQQYPRVDVRTIDDFPLLVRHISSDNYQVLSHEICMEVDPLALTEDRWAFLLETNIEITVDDRPIRPAFLDIIGGLTPRPDDETMPEVDAAYFSYCFTSDWGTGYHPVTLQVSKNQESLSYSWALYIP